MSWHYNMKMHVLLEQYRNDTNCCLINITKFRYSCFSLNENFSFICYAPYLSIFYKTLSIFSWFFFFFSDSIFISLFDSIFPEKLNSWLCVPSLDFSTIFCSCRMCSVKFLLHLWRNCPKFIAILQHWYYIACFSLLCSLGSFHDS